MTDASAFDSEEQLVASAKERSPSAWAEIYDTHYRRLFRYCYARTSDEGTAAELASGVFLEALEGIDRYQYRGKPLLAWLYRIARNVVADYHRKREREAGAMRDAASMAERHDPSPASEIADREDLLAAMAELTDDQRQVIALRFYAGLDTHEIAETLERSEAAVYSLEVRALAALRKRLAPGRLDEIERRTG